MLGFFPHGMQLTEADSSALLALVPAPSRASYKNQNKPQIVFALEGYVYTAYLSRKDS